MIITKKNKNLIKFVNDNSVIGNIEIDGYNLINLLCLFLAIIFTLLRLFTKSSLVPQIPIFFYSNNEIDNWKKKNILKIIILFLYIILLYYILLLLFFILLEFFLILIIPRKLLNKIKIKLGL